MSSLTCITCGVYFVDSECQKRHYKCEWHQYNLKRKVVGLEAIDFDSFTKLKQNQIDADKQMKDKEDTYCKCCRKLFGTSKALKQHYQSKKHRESELEFNCKTKLCLQESNQLNQSEPSNLSSKIGELNEDVDKNSDSDEWYDVDEEIYDDLDEIGDGQLPSLNQCLFCSHLSSSIEDNIKHMSEKHSFFIPDVKYLIDLNGLLKHLAEKIFIYHQCIWCNQKSKSFHSFQAVQNHIISKGHSKIQFESSDVLLEYSPFYDYSSSYPNDGADADEEIVVNEIDGDNCWELVLPSGSVIGHRSLFQYYKQNLRPVKENGSCENRKKVLDKVISSYRLLGWDGSKSQLAATKRAKDINCFNRYMSKRSLDIGLKHNKTSQPHFRNQVFF